MFKHTHTHLNEVFQENAEPSVEIEMSKCCHFSDSRSLSQVNIKADEKWQTEVDIKKKGQLKEQCLHLSVNAWDAEAQGKWCRSCRPCVQHPHLRNILFHHSLSQFPGCDFHKAALARIWVKKKKSLRLLNKTSGCHGNRSLTLHKDTDLLICNLNYSAGRSAQNTFGLSAGASFNT